MNDPIKCIAIDDEPLALDIIENFCHRIGNIELRKYSDPLIGLEEIRRNGPDIVFLDIEMEGINGIALASQLPENGSAIPVGRQYATELINASSG